MKTIKLEVSGNKGNYYILLGIGQKVKFDTVTKANEHVRNLKRVLKDSVNVLVSIRSDLYGEYGMNYLYLNREYEKCIIKNLHSFDQRLPFVFKEYGKGNASFAISAINYLYSSIEQTIDLFRDYAHKNKQYALITKIKAINKEFYLLKEHYRKELKNISCNDSYQKRGKMIRLQNETINA